MFIFLIYLASIAENIAIFFEIMAMILFIISITIVLALFAIHDDPHKHHSPYTRLVKIIMPIGLLCLFISNTIPDRKSIYIMMSVYTVEKVATSDTTSRLWDKSMSLIETRIDEAMKDTSGIIEQKLIETDEKTKD